MNDNTFEIEEPDNKIIEDAFRRGVVKIIQEAIAKQDKETIDIEVGFPRHPAIDKVGDEFYQMARPIARSLFIEGSRAYQIIGVTATKEDLLNIASLIGDTNTTTCH